MQKYIGTKLVEAEHMTRGDYNLYRGWPIPENENPEDEGYLIKYPDGYESWSPKAVFEKSYLAVEDNKQLPSGVSIGQKMVDEFISYTETITMGERTTVVRCVLRNGMVFCKHIGLTPERNHYGNQGNKKLQRQNRRHEAA